MSVSFTRGGGGTSTLHGRVVLGGLSAVRRRVAAERLADDIVGCLAHRSEAGGEKGGKKETGWVVEGWRLSRAALARTVRSASGRPKSKPSICSLRRRYQVSSPEKRLMRADSSAGAAGGARWKVSLVAGMTHHALAAPAEASVKAGSATGRTCVHLGAQRGQELFKNKDGLLLHLLNLVLGNGAENVGELRATVWEGSVAPGQHGHGRGNGMSSGEYSDATGDAAYLNQPVLWHPHAERVPVEQVLKGLWWRGEGGA